MNRTLNYKNCIQYGVFWYHSMLWGFCKPCHYFRNNNCRMKECDNCDDFYCSLCEPCREDIICCMRHGRSLNFCCTECMDAYVETFWRCNAVEELNDDTSSLSSISSSDSI